MVNNVGSVLSAVVWRPGRNGGDVLVKESTKGFSLLGSDRIDWSKGVVEGLAGRVVEQHGLLIHPYAINGIYSGVSPSGKQVALNLNFRARACFGHEDKTLHWVQREELLSGKYDVNTPDLLEALKDLDLAPRAGLDFIVSGAINGFVKGREGNGGEITASSTVIYNPFSNSVCFALRKDGLLSNVGGKVESSSLLNEYFRENYEECGRSLSGDLRGFIAAFTKRTPRGRFVTSLPAFAVVHEEDFSPRREVVESGELYGLEWIGAEELRKVSPDRFYTPDSLASAIFGIDKYEQGGSFVSTDILRSVRV